MTEQELYKKAFLPLHAAKEISLKREIMEQTVEDTEYQIKTAKEIERLLLNTNVDDFREREKDKNEEDNR